MKTTSLEAWRKLQGTLSASRFKVYEAIARMPGSTATEIERYIKSTSGHKRVVELVRMGLVREAEPVMCSITGHSAHALFVTDRDEPIPLPQASILDLCSRRVAKLIRQHKIAEARRALSELEGFGGER